MWEFTLIYTVTVVDVLLYCCQNGLTFSREPTRKMDYLCSATAVLSKGTTVPYHHMYMQNLSPFR